MKRPANEEADSDRSGFVPKGTEQGNDGACIGTQVVAGSSACEFNRHQASVGMKNDGDGDDGDDDS